MKKIIVLILSLLMITACSNNKEKLVLVILASDGMLVKRPLLVSDRAVIPGFNEKTWEAVI